MTMEQNDPIPIQIDARLACLMLVDCQIGQARVPRGVHPEKLGRGVWPASQNPFPIYDQNLRFSQPYL